MQEGIFPRDSCTESLISLALPVCGCLKVSDRGSQYQDPTFDLGPDRMGYMLARAEAVVLQKGSKALDVPVIAPETPACAKEMSRAKCSAQLLKQSLTGCYHLEIGDRRPRDQHLLLIELFAR
jgi:hypothetical protein